MLVRRYGHTARQIAEGLIRLLRQFMVHAANVAYPLSVHKKHFPGRSHFISFRPRLFRRKVLQHPFVDCFVESLFILFRLVGESVARHFCARSAVYSWHCRYPQPSFRSYNFRRSWSSRRNLPTASRLGRRRKFGTLAGFDLNPQPSKRHRRPIPPFASPWPANRGQPHRESATPIAGS